MNITLKTLSQATAQQVFDQVARHLLQQRRRAIKVDAGFGAKCRYRAPDGAKCAIGCLIGDLEYDPEFEGHSWPQLLERSKRLGYNLPAEHLELLKTLQGIHDGTDPDFWRGNLKVVAERWGLATTALQ